MSKKKIAKLADTMPMKICLHFKQKGNIYKVDSWLTKKWIQNCLFGNGSDETLTKDEFVFLKQNADNYNLKIKVEE